jgi:hypothetical protein
MAGMHYLNKVQYNPSLHTIKAVRENFKLNHTVLYN